MVSIDSREWAGAIARMSELSRKEPAIIVRNLGRDYTRGVLEATPIAKPTYWRKVTRADGQTVYVRRETPKRPLGTGFAKAGWVRSRIWAKISKVNSYASKQEEWADKYSGIEDNLRDWIASIALENRVPYIGELDSRANIEEHGIEKAKKQLAKGIASYEAKLERANR